MSLYCLICLKLIIYLLKYRISCCFKKKNISILRKIKLMHYILIRCSNSFLLLRNIVITATTLSKNSLTIHFALCRRHWWSSHDFRITTLSIPVNPWVFLNLHIDFSPVYIQCRLRYIFFSLYLIYFKHHSIF